MTGKQSGSCHSAVGAGFEGMNLTKPLRGQAPAGGIASRGGLPGRKGMGIHCPIMPYLWHYGPVYVQTGSDPDGDDRSAD